MENKKSGMKDLVILLGVVLAAILIFVGVSVGSDFVKDNGFANSVKEISYKDLQQKIDTKEDFILFYGANSCSACKTYKPTFGEVAKDNSDVTSYYIDIESMNEKDRKTLAADTGAKATPTIYLFVDGKRDYKFIEGAANKEDTNDLFDYFKSRSK